jgi:hypothetical protein
MTYPQAIALSEATRQLPDEVTAEIETGMLRFCHRQSLAHFRNALRGWVARKDPNYTRKATAERREPVVEHRATDDGCGELFIRGPLEITTQISMALTAYAAKTKATLGGSAAQRKLAGLRDMIETYLGTPAAPRQHGRLPILNVCIDLATLLGLRDGIAEIPGVGAIPAEAARWLIADGAPFRRMVIDPDTGALLELGHTTYTATPALAEYLTAKNLTSASPHSNVDSRHCDMEHNTPYDPGGTTDPTNLTPIDRRWHRAKTHGGWTYQKNPDGIITWTSPTGLSCTIEPHDYRSYA